MCDARDDAPVLPVDAVPAGTEWRGEVLPLEPVDEVAVLTVCDNTVDLLLADQGPVTRLPMSTLPDGPKLLRTEVNGGSGISACPGRFVTNVGAPPAHAGSGGGAASRMW